MAITIDEMSTEVIAEPPLQLTGASAAQPATERLDEIARARFTLAQAARLAQRLSAEGYDD